MVIKHDVAFKTCNVIKSAEKNKIYNRLSLGHARTGMAGFETIGQPQHSQSLTDSLCVPREGATLQVYSVRETKDLPAKMWSLNRALTLTVILGYLSPSRAYLNLYMNSTETRRLLGKLATFINFT